MTQEELEDRVGEFVEESLEDSNEHQNELNRTSDDEHNKSKTPSIEKSKSPSQESEQSNGSHQSRRTTVSLVESLGVKPFGFESRTSHDATEGLTINRSQNFVPFIPEIDDNIWKRPPPDFRPQCFAPRPPKRNSRDSMKPWLYKSESDDVYEEYVRKQKDRVTLPHIARSRTLDEEEPFVTRFKLLDSHGAKLVYPREGMYKPGPYKMPKPHDFRGYPPIASLGLPEFYTDYEHDPYNLIFKSKRLNTIHGLNTEPPTNRDIRGRQMAPPKTPQPKYDARLIMPFDKWPTKHYEYTRHRRLGRSPESALMERIETTLSAQWAREKMEAQLRKARNVTAHL